MIYIYIMHRSLQTELHFSFSLLFSFTIDLAFDSFSLLFSFIEIAFDAFLAGATPSTTTYTFTVIPNPFTALLQ